MSQDPLDNYYRLLKLSPGASEREIKLAYRRLAFEFHPDRNSDPDAEERFKDVTEAYEILTGTRKRPADATARKGANTSAKGKTSGTGQCANPGPNAAGNNSTSQQQSSNNRQGTRQGFAGTGRKDDRYAEASAAYQRHQSKKAERGPNVHPGARRHAKTARSGSADAQGFLRCAITDVVSAQPRHVEFTVVSGFFNSVRRETISAVLAPKGARRMALRATFKTWLKGFWGWRSWLAAWRAIIGNMRGGIFPPEANAQLLLNQASAFERSGNKPLARAVLLQAAGFIGNNRSVLAERIRANLRRLDDGLPARRVRDEWKRVSMFDAFLHLSPIVGVIFALLVAFGPAQSFIAEELPGTVIAYYQQAKSRIESLLPHEEKSPYYVDKPVLNLRKGAGLDFPIVRQLNRFETVYLTGPNESFWIEVRTTLGETGYVNADALVPGDGASARETWCAKNKCD